MFRYIWGAYDYLSSMCHLYQFHKFFLIFLITCLWHFISAVKRE